MREDRPALSKPSIFAVVVLVMALAVAAQTAIGASSSSSSDWPPLVGRWATQRTCQGLVASARMAGLEALAPQIVGDYFPGQTPQQLAKKPNLCAGATGQLHSHFFNGQGLFGSLDQRGQQVDDGHYRMVSGNTFKIGKSTFRYKIARNALSLTPVIPAKLVRLGRANPLAPNDAGWMIAVAYAGHKWKRVPCNTRC